MAKTNLHAFKAKDTRFVADWLKSKGLHKLCCVFEGIQEPFTLSLACKSVVSPCLHTQLPERNKSYQKVSRGWGHLITWNGPMMGHLNSISASGRGNFPKIFQKFKCRGGGGGRGGCWSFDLTGTLHLKEPKMNFWFLYNTVTDQSRISWIMACPFPVSKNEFFGSFDMPWSNKSCIDLFSKICFWILSNLRI